MFINLVKSMFSGDKEVEMKARDTLDTCTVITDPDRCEQAYKRFSCVVEGFDEIRSSRPKPGENLKLKIEYAT